MSLKDEIEELSRKAASFDVLKADYDKVIEKLAVIQDEIQRIIKGNKVYNSMKTKEYKPNWRKELIDEIIKHAKFIEPHQLSITEIEKMTLAKGADIVNDKSKRRNFFSELKKIPYLKKEGWGNTSRWFYHE